MRLPRSTGQGMVEYALVLLLIAIVSLLALQMMGVSVSDVYCQVGSSFTKNACSQAFCDDNMNSLDGAANLSGPWTNSNGQTCIRGGGNLYNKCSMSDMNTNDYTARLDAANLTTGNGYGIFFRATYTASGVNGYAFQYDPGASGFVIRKWVNGREIYPSLAQVVNRNYDWYSKPHTLELKAVGNQFTGYVDGLAVITATDNTYASGGTGIRTWDSTNLCVDNFSVNPPQP